MISLSLHGLNTLKSSTINSGSTLLGVLVSASLSVSEFLSVVQPVSCTLGGLVNIYSKT